MLVQPAARSGPQQRVAPGGHRPGRVPAASPPGILAEADVAGVVHPILDRPRFPAGARAAMPDDAFALAWAEGLAMTLGQAVEYAVGDDAG